MFHHGHRETNSSDYRVELARGQVAGQSVETISGRNASVGTSAEDVWEQGATQTMMTSASTLYISSSSASDTTQTITVEALDGNYNAVVLSATIGGQSQVELKASGDSQTALRVLRAYNSTNTALVGDVYVAESNTLTGGVPDTATKIHSKIAIGKNHSRQSHWTIPAGKSGYILGVEVSASCATAENKTAVELYVRDNSASEPARVLDSVIVHNGHASRKYSVPIQVAEKSDIHFSAVSANASDDVAVSYQLIVVG